MRFSVRQFLCLAGCLVLALCVLLPIGSIGYVAWRFAAAEELSNRFTRHSNINLESFDIENSTDHSFSFSEFELIGVRRYMNEQTSRLSVGGKFSMGCAIAYRTSEQLVCDWQFPDKSIRTTARVATFGSEPYLLFEIPEYDYDGTDMLTFNLELRAVLNDARLSEFMEGAGSGPNPITTK